jgi:hypothetical protein
MKCIVCFKPTYSSEVFCNVCDSKISVLSEALKLNDNLLSFVIENSKWLSELADKCNTDWHGKLMLSAKGGKLILAGWYQTMLLSDD